MSTRSVRRELQRRMPTVYISEDLRTMLATATDRQRDVLMEMILFYDKQLERMLSEHPTELPGIAGGLHDAMDGPIKANLASNPQARDVKCGRGCDHCCHMNVDITEGEAELLLLVARDRGITLDASRLRNQAGRGVDGLRELPREDRACAFLKDGACSVYEHRPGACRKLNVVTDPIWCDAVNHPGHVVGRIATGEAEVIWTVMMTRERSGSMPDMLLGAIKETT